MKLHENIQPQELSEEITGLDCSERRIVMACINEGVDIRAMKEAKTLRDAGYQVIIVRRSLSGHKPLEEIDDITFLSVPSIRDAAGLYSALSNRVVSQTLSWVTLIELHLLAIAAYFFGYSFATAKVVRRYPNKLLRIVNMIARRTIQPWHTLVVYKLYQCEYIAAMRLLKPDVIHAHDLFMLRLSLEAAKKTGARCVYDAHELESERRHGTHKILTYAIKREEAFYAPKADAVITVSPMIARIMETSLGIDRPYLILNAPVLKHAKFTSVRKKLGLKKNIPLVVFVGKIFDIYRHDHKIGILVKAIAKLPDVHFALIGAVSKNAQNQLNDLSADEQCPERIHLAGNVPAEHLVSFLRGVDVGAIVMPPHTKNTDLAMPNKLFEYLLAEMAIVSFNNQQIRDFLTPLGRGVFVEEVNAKDLSSGIITALKLKKELNNHPKLSEDIVWASSWEAQAKQLLKLYQPLMDSKMKNSTP